VASSAPAAGYRWGMATNARYELRGINHLALVCRDMAETVEFYTSVLGMPLIKTIELPRGLGQHFFFDIGNGDALAFFWFPGAPPAAPGVASALALPGRGDLVTAVGSMNHVAFDVAPERIEEYRDKLIASGIGSGRSSTTTTALRGWRVSSTMVFSSGRSTSSIPTGSCSSSRRGPASLRKPTSSMRPPGRWRTPPPEGYRAPRLRAQSTRRSATSSRSSGLSLR
jgi:catechol 2,3-dioxygenase-like lactoylglutathione lyase family enzyme